MSRIPPLPRDHLDPEQQTAYDKLTQFSESSFGAAFKYKDHHGAFIGPFPFCLAQPSVGLKAMECLQAISAIPGLSPEAKQVAILTTGAHFKGTFELYAHANVAVKEVGLPLEHVEAIIAGTKPDGLSEECQLAYDVARRLASVPGPLRQELWDESVRMFGRDGTVALLHYVGFYAYICISMLNGIDAKAPKDEDSVVQLI